MPRGGDRRPLIHPSGRDLHYTRLLLRVLWHSTSDAGIRFNAEREALFRYWERLIRVLSHYDLTGWGIGPPGILENFGKYLDSVEFSHTIEYPKPRGLTPEEQAEIKLRQNAASEALDDIYEELKPFEDGSSEAVNQLWNDITRYLQHWIREVQQTANSGVRDRYPRRSMVKRYRLEVEEFCDHWHLTAWWAVPTMHQNHFERVEEGVDEPLEIYVTDIMPHKKYTIVAKLPGVGEAEFERDKGRFRDVMLEELLQTDSGPLRIKQRPFRDQMAAIEREHGRLALLLIGTAGTAFQSASTPA